MITISPWAYPGIKGSKLPDKQELLQYLIEHSVALFGFRWTELTAEEFVQYKRKREKVNARFMVYYLIKQNTDMKLKVIGSLFGQDHTTVINGCKKHENYYQTEERYRDTYNKFVDTLSMKFILKSPQEKIKRLASGTIV